MQRRQFRHIVDLVLHVFQPHRRTVPMLLIGIQRIINDPVVAVAGEVAGTYRDRR
jgi:hypothetical protein